MRRRSTIFIILALSLTLNASVLVAGCYVFVKRGGVSYLQDRFHPKGGAIFFGDSLTNLGDWVLDSQHDIDNWGERGDETGDVLRRAQKVIDRRPDTVFLMVGTNDALRGRDLDTSVKKFAQAVQLLHQGLPPKSVLYIETVFPVTDRTPTPSPEVKGRAAEVNAWIDRFNEKMAPLANGHNVILVNMHDDFLRDGQLIPEYTVDGVHLNVRGYWAWRGDTLPLLP